jgi:hypothetical protein
LVDLLNGARYCFVVRGRSNDSHFLLAVIERSLHFLEPATGNGDTGLRSFFGRAGQRDLLILDCRFQPIEEIVWLRLLGGDNGCSSASCSEK